MFCLHLHKVRMAFFILSNPLCPYPSHQLSPYPHEQMSGKPLHVGPCSASLAKHKSITTWIDVDSAALAEYGEEVVDAEDQVVCWYTSTETL